MKYPNNLSCRGNWERSLLNMKTVRILSSKLLYFLNYLNLFISCSISHENRSFNERAFSWQCSYLINNCSCQHVKPYIPNHTFTNIVCVNASNSSNLFRIYNEYDIFNVHEITFKDFKYLPAKVLQRLNVYTLILDDPDITVDKQVLDGIISLTRCDVQRSNIKNIPLFIAVKDSIEVIRIHSSRLTSLKGRNLQNLTRIKELSFVNNSIRFLHPEAFQGTVNVQSLDLSYNLLTYLPPRLLNSMKKLKIFAASYNNLLHVTNLFVVTHPQDIYLDYNSITEPDTILHENMENVELFKLSGNPIKRISEKTFNGKVPNVKDLYLASCNLEVFRVEHYKNLSKLVNLDLSYNLFEEIPKQDMRNDNSVMKISLEILDLNSNKLKNLNILQKFTQISSLEVAKNQIKYLTDEDLKVAHLKYSINFRENAIRNIESKAFNSSGNNLEELDLSSNFIKSLNGSLKYLAVLRSLNISYNLIQSFAEDEFTGLKMLSQIYLQNNQIKTVGPLQRLPKLKYLGIGYNDIKLIKPDQISNSWELMTLAGNPLTCDCRIQPLILRLNRSRIPETDIQLCSQSDFSNSLNNTKACPEMCSCACTVHGNVSFISIDCSSKNLSTVPQFLRNSFKQGDVPTTFDTRRPLLIDQNLHPSLRIGDRVLGINLEDNSLESLEGCRFPSELIQLYLAHNKLKRLPDFIFSNQRNLKQISLSGNPWQCDCDTFTLKFKEWLVSNYGKIQDIKNVSCRVSNEEESNVNGRVIWTLTDADICPTYVWLIVSLFFSALTFLTLCLVAKILYAKHELSIKVFLYFHGFTFMKEEDVDCDKKFDAFFSFSEVDGEFVAEKIIKVTESKNPNIRLFIHYRDFKAGELIQNNIIYAVHNSKRTVLILSRNFLESEWCLMEFRTAHEKAQEDKVHRIIIIKFGDLPKEIDPTIKAYLDNTTYLTWGEKYFWNKLLFVLPTSTTVRNPVPRNAGEKAIT